MRHIVVRRFAASLFSLALSGHTDPTVVELIWAFELEASCEWWASQQGEWHCLCGTHSGCKHRSDYKITIIITSSGEAESIENLRGFDHVVRHAAYCITAYKHTYLQASLFSCFISISRLLFCPRIVHSQESAGSVCAVCRVVLDKLFSFVYRLCSFHCYVLSIHRDTHTHTSGSTAWSDTL